MSDTGTALARLARLARLGQIVAWGGLAIVVSWITAALALPGVRDGWLGTMGVSAGDNALLAALVAALPATLFAYCLWQAGLLFGALRSAAPFSPLAVQSLVSLGWGAVATAIAGVVCRMAVHYLASFSSPDGTRTLDLSLSSTDIGTLLVGVLALAFALVVAEAQRLEGDARSIV